MSYQSSSIHDPRWIHDVFLSFSGDVGATFTSSLYNSLTNAGVSVFMGDEELPRGDQISPSIIQAIEGSRISVVVCSKNYVESTWCLQELEEIMDCSRILGQRVVPVFYDLDPLDVRNQRGEFGAAFEYLETRISEDKVKVWRAALQEATYISGFDLHNSRNENEDVMKIVEHITRLLDWKDLFVAHHPVGVAYRAQDVLKLLKYRQSKNPILLGICGMGGIGKTTIAKAVYNKIRHEFDFEGGCFLLDIREVWKQDNGGVRLQEQLLSDIYKTMKVKIQNIEYGKSKLMERLPQKRILVVLDNVDKLEQLYALAGSRKWFSPKSIVIITTRDRHLLDIHGVEEFYELKEMNDTESVELFSWHAFKQARPKENLLDATRRVVQYCWGWPLALKVIGYLLFDKKLNEWNSILEDLHKAPHYKPINLLRLCVRRLNGENEKKIFFEICCFFVGVDRNDAIQVLNRYGLLAEIGISNLVDRNLVTVDNENRLGITHDVLEEMGRFDIDQSETTGEPKIYDLFLSFRGEDTRASFISHMYASLQSAGIYTFKDDDEIQRGDGVSISLMEAIKISRICVVVLSRNYANSRWCLEELENIIESRSALGLVVVPVFYGVDPSEVRNQTGMFGQAFEDLKNRFEMSETKELRWKEALLEVGGIAGFVILKSREQKLLRDLL